MSYFSLYIVVVIIIIGIMYSIDEQSYIGYKIYACLWLACALNSFGLGEELRVELFC